MNSMPQKGILTGAILIILGLAGYFAGGQVSATALIPAFFGLPLLVVSLMAMKPEKLKLGMHLAATVGLLGFLAPLGRIVPKLAKGEFEMGLATTSMIAMVVVCGIFVFSCILSFRAARKSREKGEIQ